MEALVRHPVSNPQDEMLKRYCAEAEARIVHASSARQAREWGEEICSKLERECSSKLILDATRTYIDRIIQEIFHQKR